MVRTFRVGHETTQKEILQYKFNERLPDKRLLAIGLDGFSHSIWYDDGTKESEVQQLGYSAYNPELSTEDWNSSTAKYILGSEPHYMYQGNPKQILYVSPEER